MGCYCCKPLIDFFYGPVPKQKLSPRVNPGTNTTENPRVGNPRTNTTEPVREHVITLDRTSTSTELIPPSEGVKGVNVEASNGDKTVLEHTGTEISLTISDETDDKDVIVELDADWYRIDRV